MARWSTSAPHRLHECGCHKGVPSGRPTGTQMDSSSIQNSREETGRTFSQVPDSLVVVARRRARDLVSGVLSMMNSTTASILGKSHDFCL